MTTCLETRSSTFRLYDQFGEEDVYTLVDVEVKHLRYAGRNEEFYDISYAYRYSSGNESRRLGHPFAREPDLEEHESGELIAVNELSTVLVKFLLMSLDELEGQCGHVTPDTYKVSVMHAITRLWD